MRSLSLLPSSAVASVRVLVVTPSVEAVEVIMKVLKPVADTLWTTILSVTEGNESLGECSYFSRYVLRMKNV